jgi:hypothetical protein
MASQFLNQNIIHATSQVRLTVNDPQLRAKLKLLLTSIGTATLPRED